MNRKSIFFDSPENSPASNFSSSFLEGSESKKHNYSVCNDSMTMVSNFNFFKNYISMIEKIF